MAEELEFSQDDPQLQIFLRQSRIFKDIHGEDLATITSFLKKFRYDEGEIIFSQGGLEAAIYIIEKGRCAIEKSSRCINILNSGNIFGEVSMLGKQPHVATARAIKETTLYILPAEILIEEHISAHSLVRIYKELGSLVTSYIRGEDALYQEIDVLLIQDGGCSPGYNSVTSFIVQFLEHYQRSVFVAATGFKSLVEGGGAVNLRCLIYNEKLYKQLEHIPGVIHAPMLREERGARFRCERYEGFRLLENQEKAAKTILKHKTRVVVAVGGNGTLEGLKSLSKLLPGDLQSFFIPATIDSDIYGTECIGQHAGVEMGAEKVRCYMADARTHKRCYIIEMMGARGGHHALHSCLGAGAHLAVLPGFNYDIKKIAYALKDRDYTVIVVAEGYKRDYRKSNGIADNAAEFFYKELMDEGLQTKQRIICEAFSRDIRGASPNNMDITLAQRLARNLTQLILQGKTYMMPAVLSGKEYALHLDEIQTDNSVSEELVVLANRLGDSECITGKLQIGVCMQPIDDVVLNFSPSAVVAMNIILGIVMFGVALDMKAADFDNIRKFPRSVGIGLLSQFLFLPAFTFLLILILDPIPSMAMGMLLVAACPGGNISNFLTHFAKGNTALSVCMSAISTLCAIFMTPLNFAFWGSYHPEVSKILKQISISPLDMAVTILCILGLPLVAGLFIAEKYPRIATRLKEPMKKFSLVVFVGFVVVALVANWNSFVAYISWVFIIVLLHNSTALATGYLGATFLRLPHKDRKAITIEVGIQNSALGLTIIFTFFQQLGGMAIVACWWGIWHIIAGLSIAYYWARKENA